MNGESAILVPKLPLGKSKHEITFPRGSLPTKDFRKILTSFNLKSTPQRLLILKALQSGQVHVTVLELLEKVKKEDPTVGFVTVYRLLKVLADRGYVTEVRTGSGPARYELNLHQHHDHMTCTRCGKICEFESPDIENLQLQVANKLGFRLTHHVLELFGVCSTCEKNSMKGTNAERHR